MKRMLSCFVLAMLGISMHGISQLEIRKQLLGNWYSVNRPDTLTLKFISDSTVFFEIKNPAPFTGMPFGYFVYKIDKQLIMELTPPGSNFHMKLLLWILNPNEMKLQGGYSRL